VGEVSAHQYLPPYLDNEIKGKVVSVLAQISTAPLKRVGEFRSLFSTSSLLGKKWSTSHGGSFIPVERVPSTHYIGSSVDPRAENPTFNFVTTSFSRQPLITLLICAVFCTSVNNNNKKALTFWRLNVF
jgi:hypothetical protein